MNLEKAKGIINRCKDIPKVDAVIYRDVNGNNISHWTYRGLLNYIKEKEGLNGQEKDKIKQYQLRSIDKLAILHPLRFLYSGIVGKLKQETNLNSPITPKYKVNNREEKRKVFKERDKVHNMVLNLEIEFSKDIMYSNYSYETVYNFYLDLWRELEKEVKRMKLKYFDFDNGYYSKKYKGVETYGDNN